MEYLYDGPSLPMLEVGQAILRFQVLDKGQWRTLESEAEYNLLIEKMVQIWHHPPKPCGHDDCQCQYE